MFHTKHEVKCLYVSAVYLTRQRNIVNSLLMQLQSEWRTSLQLTTCQCTHMTLEGASVYMCVCVRERLGLGLGLVEPWALWDMVMEDGTLPLPTTSHWSLLPPVGLWVLDGPGRAGRWFVVVAYPLLCFFFWFQAVLVILGHGVLSSACARMAGIWPGQLPVASGPLTLVSLAMGDKSVASLFLLQGWAHSCPWVVWSRVFCLLLANRGCYWELSSSLSRTFCVVLIWMYQITFTLDIFFLGNQMCLGQQLKLPDRTGIETVWGYIKLNGWTSLWGEVKFWNHVTLTCFQLLPVFLIVLLAVSSIVTWSVTLGRVSGIKTVPNQKLRSICCGRILWKKRKQL